jgi:hypothetical protein
VAVCIVERNIDRSPAGGGNAGFEQALGALLIADELENLDA